MEKMRTASGERLTPLCAIGVLFVHGIGAQRRGETLASFARPIYRWLDESFMRLPQQQWLRERSSLEALKTSYDALRSKAEAVGAASEATAWALEELRRLLESAQASPLTTSERRSGSTGHLGGETVAARVTLTDARLSVPEAPEAPAYATLVLQRLRLDGQLEEERWLLA